MTFLARSSKLWLSMLIAALAFFVLPGPSRSAAQEQTTWKAFTLQRYGEAWEKRWPWLLEEVKKNSGGQLQLDVSTLPELGFGGAELLKVLRANLLDFGDVTAGFVSGEFPAIEAPQLPGLYRDNAQIRQAVEAWLPHAIDTNSRILGGRVIASTNFNSVFLFSKFPVSSLDDIKGRKIRVFSASLAEYISALGGEPVNIPLAELYSALQLGTIDGALTGPDQVEGGKLYEVASHITDLRLANSPVYTVVSQKSWDRLPEDLQKVVLDLSPELTRRGWEVGEENDRIGLEAARKRNMTVTVPAKPEWLPKLDEIAHSIVAKKWAERVGPETTALFNEVIGPIIDFRINE